MAAGPVASIDQPARGVTTWKQSISGDPAFSFVETSQRICAGQPPVVVTVMFRPPVTAVPGDQFDAVVTINADGNAFAPGTVMVHGEVAAPSVTVDKTVIDFGDLAYGVEATQTITFQDTTDSITNIMPAAGNVFPFHIDRGVPTRTGSTWTISVSYTDGDYAVDSVWTDSISNEALPAACNWSQTIPLRAHVLPFDAGAGVGPNDDGGADRAVDVP
jgi:hypothetical protein